MPWVQETEDGSLIRYGDTPGDISATPPVQDPAGIAGSSTRPGYDPVSLLSTIDYALRRKVDAEYYNQTTGARLNAQTPVIKTRSGATVPAGQPIISIGGAQIPLGLLLLAGVAWFLLHKG